MPAASVTRSDFGYNDHMDGTMKNIFLTGAPSSGKTTVIRKVIEGLALPAGGFYTEEERRDGKRVGFLMKTLDGRSAYLAHQDIGSAFRIRCYGVSVGNIEAIAVPSIAPVRGRVIILDEIGKMECLSEVFRKAAVHALDSPNIVVGTITFGGDGFILAVKARADIQIHEVTPGNRDALPGLILTAISELLVRGRGSIRLFSC